MDPALVTSYVKDNEGSTFIAASQRPDGTWRKPRRVKEGFVPQEEVPLYESKGKKVTKALDTGLPPGLTQEAWERMKQQQKALTQRPTGISVDPVPKAKSNTNSTGLSAEDSWVTIGAKGKKKKGAQQSVADKPVKQVKEITSQLNTVSISSSNEPKLTTEPSQPVATDPVKRLRNLRKKLTDIEKLKKTDPAKLGTDQVAKVGRLKEVLDEISALEAEIGHD
ncbi:hypothetical protein HDE_01948 [Halotydeus destructor]|nr:hypothetical protein HDE_01948 [Halotydeus destructor]